MSFPNLWKPSHPLLRGDKEFTVELSLKFTTLHKSFSVLQLTNEISKNFPQNHAVPGLFFKNCSGIKVGKYYQKPTHKKYESLLN